MGYLFHGRSGKNRVSQFEFRNFTRCSVAKSFLRVRRASVADSFFAVESSEK